MIKLEKYFKHNSTHHIIPGPNALIYCYYFESLTVFLLKKKQFQVYKFLPFVFCSHILPFINDNPLY